MLRINFDSFIFPVVCGLWICLIRKFERKKNHVGSHSLLVESAIDGVIIVMFLFFLLCHRRRHSPPSPQTVSKTSCVRVCLSVASKSNGRNRWINNCFKVNKRNQVTQTHTTRTSTDRRKSCRAKTRKEWTKKNETIQLETGTDNFNSSVLAVGGQCLVARARQHRLIF